MDRRLGGILFGLTLASYAYFAQAGGWNHNSRFDVARALVERHTLAIDEYRENTGDLAFLGAHYYSDKAPLTGVIAALPYAAAAALRPALPAALRTDESFLPLASQAVTVCVSGLAAALTALLLFLVARRGGASPRGAAALALAFGLGSYAFPFATVLFGHLPAAALLFGAFFAGTRARGAPGHALAGLLAGLAVFAEYPTAGAAALVLGHLAAARPDRRWRAVVLPFAAGALLPAALAMGYAWLAFHDLFAVGYQHVVDGEIGTSGFFGLSWPRPLVVAELLGGLRRGLFVGAPVLAACAFGLIVGLRRSAVFRLCAAVCVYYLLFIAAYAWWDGGSSFGPRHLIPMLPFLCLGGLHVVDRWPGTFFVLTAVSALLMLAGTARTPVPAAEEGILQVVGHTLSGEVADPGVPGVLGLGESSNLGLQLGLPGRLSLAPLLVLWILGSAAIAWLTRRRSSPGSPPPSLCSLPRAREHPRGRARR